MYLVFGQFQQSLSSLKALRAAPRAADMKVQNEMTIRARFVELLYALGAFKEAAERIKAIINEPDRADGQHGGRNHRADQSSARVVRLSGPSRAAPRACERAPPDRALKERRAQLGVLRLQRATARRAIRLASIPGNLLRVARPYMSDLMPWYGVDMAQVLGTGVVSQIVDQAKQTETRVSTDCLTPISMRFCLRVCGGGGDRLGAIEQGLSLLKRLPKEPDCFG